MSGNSRIRGQKSSTLSGNRQWSRASHWKETKRSKVKGTSEQGKFGCGTEDNGLLELKV